MRTFEEICGFLKIAYFQGGGGVNEPTPKKKKYKSDPAILVQPRFEEMFYHNMGLYNIPGMYGAGPGYHQLLQEKSVKDFSEHRRTKNKYKSQDLYIQDDGSLTTKASLYNSLKKVAIDFKLDNIDVDPIPVEGNSDLAYTNPIVS